MPAPQANNAWGWHQSGRATVPGDQSDRRGELAGKVTGVQGGRSWCGLATAREGQARRWLGEGQARRWRGNCRPARRARRARVFADPAGKGTLKLVIKGDSFDIRQVQPGSELFKTDDPQVRKQLEQSYSRDVVSTPADSILRCRQRPTDLA